MIDKNTFMETVRFAAEAVKKADGALSEEEIASYFSDMDLSHTQQQMIFQYLKEQKSGHKRIEKSIEMELPDSAFFRMYMEDLKNIVTCTKQEESNLYKRLIEGDDTALHKLSEQWLARVFELAKKCAPAAEDLPDMIQEGNMGVFLALEQLLGSGREADYVQILNDAADAAMQKYILDSNSEKEMEQSMLAKVSLVYEAQKYLTEEFQRLPTITELSQYTKISEEELEDIFRTIKES